MAKPTNLFEYYKQQGESLPSIQERSKLYENLGLGSAKAYSGSAFQNKKLLDALQSDTTVEVKETETKTFETPDIINDDPNLSEIYNNLNSEQKEFINTYTNVLSQDNDDLKKKMSDAIEQAKAQADPYWAEQLTIAQDNLKINLGEIEDNLESKQSLLEKRIDRINKDLKESRDRIDIDKQAELARLKRKYEVQLENVEENMRSRGLTFSSKRRTAENRLEEERTDIVESTQRQYQRKGSDIEKQSERNIEDLRGNISDLATQVQQRGAALVRQTEAKVGTKNLPDLSGTVAEGAQMGNVSGEIQSNKQSDILSRAGAMIGLNNPIL